MQSATRSCVHVQSAELLQAVQAVQGRSLSASKCQQARRLHRARLPKMARSYCGPAVQALASGSRPLAAMLSMHQLASVAYCEQPEQAPSQGTHAPLQHSGHPRCRYSAFPGILEILHCRVHARHSWVVLACSVR